MTAPIVIPETPEELQEAFCDRKYMKSLLAEDAPVDAYAKCATAYHNKITAKDGGIERQVNEQIEASLASFAKDNFVNLKRPDMAPATAQDLRNSRQTGNAYMKETPGKALNGKFATLMDFMSVVGGDPRDEEVREGRKLIKNAMSSTDPSSGGFLVPEEFRT